MYTIPDPTTVGEMPFRGGGLEGRTWYRVTGELGVGGPPLVVLHGGPGAAHDYVLSIANLAGATGRAVVHYDQIGCGRSSHHPDADPGVWTPALFVEELRQLLAHLGIDDVHLLGQSWGGMLAPEFVLAHPDGVRTMAICDSPASMDLWLEAAGVLRERLPEDVQETLDRYEATESYDDPAYLAAMQVFYDRHVCRVVPNPPEVAASFTQIEAEPTVYHTMNGPTEFHVVGSMKGWTIVDRLPGISVPTLVVSGAHDEAMPIVWQPFLDAIEGSRSHVFPESSHMPHVEEHDAFLAVVGGFLTANDPQERP